MITEEEALEYKEMVINYKSFTYDEAYEFIVYLGSSTGYKLDENAQIFETLMQSCVADHYVEDLLIDTIDYFG